MEKQTYPQLKVKEIKASNDRAWREGRRLRAWELHQLGWTQRRIAQALGVSTGAVCKWFKAATHQGPKALLRRASAGGPSRLSSEQLQQLAGWLREQGGATSHGFMGEVWTRPGVAHLIEARFAVKYHPSQVGRILKKMGFSRQKPVKQARQRDPQAVKAWVEEQWPALKKNGE